MNNNPAFDASIPVLTEVFQDQPEKEEAARVEGTAQLADVAEELPAETSGDLEWAALERRLSERILTQLADVDLEQRVRDSIEGALQTAIAGITQEVRSGLRQTIEQIVARAVGAELAQLQSLKK